MLTGFKNAVEVDFTLEENKKKIEEAFKQAHAEAGAVYPLIIGGKKVETEKKISRKMLGGAPETAALPGIFCAVKIGNVPYIKSACCPLFLRGGIC